MVTVPTGPVAGVNDRPVGAAFTATAIETSSNAIVIADMILLLDFVFNFLTF